MPGISARQLGHTPTISLGLAALLSAAVSCQSADEAGSTTGASTAGTLDSGSMSTVGGASSEGTTTATATASVGGMPGVGGAASTTVGMGGDAGSGVMSTAGGAAGATCAFTASPTPSGRRW